MGFGGRSPPPPDALSVKLSRQMRARESRTSEMESAFPYRGLAETEKSAEHRAPFGKLATQAEAQAKIWAAEARRQGVALSEPFVPDARVRLVAVLVRRLGAARMRGVLAAMKVRGMSVYGRL